MLSAEIGMTLMPIGRPLKGMASLTQQSFRAMCANKLECHRHSSRRETARQCEGRVPGHVKRTGEAQ